LFRLTVLLLRSQESLLYRIKPTHELQVGADVKWLSAFPSEAEILYPPLTFLDPTGKTDEISVDCNGRKYSFKIVEVTPHIMA
jgi:hypothetical protein